MIKDTIKKLINGKSPEFEEIQETVEQITEGKATDAQIASFLTALRLKGETVSDITACVSVMKNKCIPVNINTPDTIDIVGTGGDCSGTFNISTTAAFTAAGAGCKVAKHGNRSISSKSGAADVLEALGANIMLAPEQSLNVFNETGICFMFAQNHHPCMKYVANVRREIGFRTIFNVLGPLMNPANTKMQLIGVYDKKLCEPIAKVLVNLGIEAGMTLHSEDGLDEASISNKTLVCEIKNSKISKYEIRPEDFGLKTASIKDILGGNAQDNAQIMLDIFNGKDKGPKYDVTLLNAALALYITGRAKDVKDGIALAKASIDSGRALQVLKKFITATNEQAVH